MSSLTRALLEAHLLEPGALDDAAPGAPLVLAVDQVTLDEDEAPLVLAAFGSLGLPRARVGTLLACAGRGTGPAAVADTPESAALRAAALRAGALVARPVPGGADALHRERLAAPGRLAVAAGLGGAGGAGAASGGALGMLVVRAGEIETAAVLAGGALRLAKPEVLEVWLEGVPAPWVGGVDLALALLARRGRPADGTVIEFGGPGAEALAVADRIAAAWLLTAGGALAVVFPSDEGTRAWLRAQGREAEWRRLAGLSAQDEPGAVLDLTALEPQVAPLDALAAARPVAQVAGRGVARVALGPGATVEELARAARILAGRELAPGVELVVMPASRQVAESATACGALDLLVAAGARVVEGAVMAPGAAGAGLCCGLAGERAGGRARWHVASAECCAAACLTGALAHPAGAGLAWEVPLARGRFTGGEPWIAESATAEDAAAVCDFPAAAPPGAPLRGEVLLRLGPGVRGEELLPSGARLDPLRGRVGELAAHACASLDPGFAARARERGGGLVVAGAELGAGPLRAAAAPALAALGVRAVLAVSFAPGLRAALVHAGVLPLCFTQDADYDAVERGDDLEIPGGQDALAPGRPLAVRDLTRGAQLAMRHDLDAREVEIVRAGGLLPFTLREPPRVRREDRP
ncbi:MAG: hypothetical protein HZC42_01105 [Candidatus Eisenbacteria bacterium]|nr:hypothetical protein [Candidatus Eisenbacteria bacterium]